MRTELEDIYSDVLVAGATKSNGLSPGGLTADEVYGLYIDRILQNMPRERLWEYQL
jgi:hypothetical protein